MSADLMEREIMGGRGDDGSFKEELEKKLARAAEWVVEGGMAKITLADARVEVPVIEGNIGDDSPGYVLKTDRGSVFCKRLDLVTALERAHLKISEPVSGGTHIGVRIRVGNEDGPIIERRGVERCFGKIFLSGGKSELLDGGNFDHQKAWLEKMSGAPLVTAPVRAGQRPVLYDWSMFHRNPDKDEIEEEVLYLASGADVIEEE